jgi:hypothetical protein
MFARRERFTKESFLKACAEVLMSLFPEGYRQNEKNFAIWYQRPADGRIPDLLSTEGRRLSIVL